MNPTTDHDMLKLTSLNQVPDLTVGKSNTRGKLLRGLQALVRFT
jgi:hypothetical protein